MSKLRNAVIKEGQDKSDLFISFENRNIRPSQVMGHPLQNSSESKEGVYRRYMNNSSSKVNQFDIVDNKAKIAEYKARMLDQKPELGFSSDKLGSVKQNTFAGRENEKLKTNHMARMSEQTGNKFKIEK